MKKIFIVVVYYIGLLLYATTPQCELHNALKLSTYDISQYYQYFPRDHEDYDELENNFAKEEFKFGSGTVTTINTTGSNNNPYHDGTDDRYLSIFEGYLYISEPGTYSIAVNGDDAVEVIIEGAVCGWYGIHGSDTTEHHCDFTFDEAGYYKLKFRHQDVYFGDNYQLYWKKPGDSDYSIIPEENLFHCTPTTPRANYQMDECQWRGETGEVEDSSGNDYNGTAQIANTTLDGFIYRGGDFTYTSQDDSNDSNKDLVQLPYTLLNGIENFTIMMWIKSDQNETTLLSGTKDNAGNNGELLMYFNDKNSFYPWIKGKENGSIILSKNLNDSSWHHIVWTRNGTENCIIIDGNISDKKCKTIDNSSGPLEIDKLVLGQSQGAQSEFNGYMDEVKIYNKVLFDQEIYNIYNNEKSNKNYDGTLRDFFLCPVEPECEIENGLWLSTYDISQYNKYFPKNHEDYDELEDNFAKESLQYGKGIVETIDTTGGNNNPYHDGTDDRYLSIFEGYLYVPEPGIYSIAVNGDDAVEVLLNENTYYGWYDRHGRDETDHNFKIFFKDPGYYKLKFRHQDWDQGDNYQLYWEKPGDSDYSIIPKENLRHCKGPIFPVTFNAVDEVSSNCNAVLNWEDNLTSKKVNEDYTVTLLAREGNITQKEKIISRVELYYFSNGNTTSCIGSPYRNILLCNDCGKTDKNGCKNLYIPVSKNDRVAKCLQFHIVAGDNNESNSTDNFAIRPDHFSMSISSNPIRAGEEFQFDFKALDSQNNNAIDYNESLNESFEIQAIERKIDCSTGDLNLQNFSFSNGVADSVDANYTEVGELNVSIHEILGSEFASVDSDDTPVNKRLITEYNSTITFLPHHFLLEGNYSNFDSENNFTYISNDRLNMASILQLNISAKNKQNDTTSNYNHLCYAKDINLTFHTDYSGSFDDINYTMIDNEGGENEGSAPISDSFSLRYAEGNFSETTRKGSSQLVLLLNFERNVSTAVNPFDLNITSIDITDGDANGSLGLEQNSSTFYYGRFFAQDIETKFSQSTETAWILFYDDNEDSYTTKTRQLRPNWWIHILHNKANDGQIKDWNITEALDLGEGFDENITLSSTTPSQGRCTLTIKNNHDPKQGVLRIIHLDIPSWLWVSYDGTSYDYQEGQISSECSKHPCLFYRYILPFKTGEVSSGIYGGSDFNLSDANTTHSGVKVFR